MNLNFYYRGDILAVRTSPTNGRIKVTSEFLFATASRGEEGRGGACLHQVAGKSDNKWHLLKLSRSGSRRIHYSAADTGFTVRQGGKAGGFDCDGFLRIY